MRGVDGLVVVKHRDGLWQWASPHPDWSGGDDWDPMVRSTYVEAVDATVVIDPLVPTTARDAELFWRALDRDVERRALPVVVLLTCAWHRRSSADVLTRYHGRAFAPDQADLPFAVTTVRDGDAPVAGIVVRDTGAPAPAREVAYAIGDDVLVTGDLVHAADGVPRLAPAGWFDESAEAAAWYRRAVTGAARALLTPVPALLLAGHGDADAAAVARFVAGLD